METIQNSNHNEKDEENRTEMEPVVGEECLDDSDSDVSPINAGSEEPSQAVKTVENNSKLFRKRKMISSVSGSDADLPVTPRYKPARAKRGRGRPPTTGHYVGLAKAKAALNAAKEQELRLRAESEVAELARKAKDLSINEHAEAPVNVDERHTAQDLDKLVTENLKLITDVATKSKNLKGTYVKALKLAADNIGAAMGELNKRTMTEEVQILKANNTRLSEEICELRKELVQLRQDLNKARQQDRSIASEVLSQPLRQDMQPQKAVSNQTSVLDVEEVSRAIMDRVATMVNARLDNFEDRLLPPRNLRPPLASDRQNTAINATMPPITSAMDARGDSGEVPATNPARNPTFAVKNGQGKKKKRNRHMNQAAFAQSEPVVTNAPTHRSVVSAAQSEEPWYRTGRKGRTVREDDPMPPPKYPAAADSMRQGAVVPKKIKLRPPRSSAVVIKLQPGAEEKGVTYAKVLGEVKQKVDLSSLGISGLRFRTAATGARVLELPGTSSGVKADSLARKIGEALDAEVAKVSRPEKCTELRLIGLDDSVTSREITETIAEQGGCVAESVKVGEIRLNSRGVGTAWVRCPVAAAKKVIDSGRLVVGWVSVQVKVLEPRPMRCFRCLQNGHVRAQCTAEADRSNECYRCGCPGHKAANCNAPKPKCSLCSAANKQSDHIIGSKHCRPPKPVPKSQKTVVPTSTISVRSSATTLPPPEIGAEEVMVIAAN